MKMHFSSAFVFATYVLAIGVSAGRPHVQPGICPNLKVADKGCIGYIKGIVTEVDLTFPTVQNECECIQECLNYPTTCASWVYKFSTPTSVQSGKRTCTLYNQFNLPSQVTIESDLNNANNQNINAPQIMANGNNPQAGGLVPQAFKDLNLNTMPDGAS